MIYSPTPQECWKGKRPLEREGREKRVVTLSSGQLCTKCFSHIPVLIMFRQYSMAPFQMIAAVKRKQIASASKRNKCRRNAFMKILLCLSISVLNECRSTVEPH